MSSDIAGGVSELHRWAKAEMKRWLLVLVTGIVALRASGAAQVSDAFTREELVGVWTLTEMRGHERRHDIVGLIDGEMTFRSDGTFEAKFDWTSRFTRKEPILNRFSGTWTLQGSALVANTVENGWTTRSNVSRDGEFLILEPDGDDKIAYYYVRKNDGNQ